MSSRNQGRGTSSSTPNETTPPRGQTPNRPRTTTPPGNASGSPNRPIQRNVGAIVPRPHAPGQGGPGGGSTGFGLQGPSGIHGLPGATAVPVGSGTGGSPGGDRLRLGGMGGASFSVKKRGLDGGPSGSSGIGEGVAGGEPEIHRCTICTKSFGSIKALFGHLRSHPERGYKGALPPPTFNAREEFADFPGAILPGVTQDEGQAADAQEGDDAQGRREEEAPPTKPFRDFDLNDSPPDASNA